MKHIIASAAALLLVCAAIPAVSVSAADSADVYVTIADAQGTLALTQEKITVTDTDGDGALTIHDALYLAHEAKYDGGAAAGYATAESTYGLSLAKLWGTENGGSYGYYVNHIAAMGMTDAVADGDFLDAFVYTDTTGWSDAYCWFDVRTKTAEAGESFDLTLQYAGFDANWNPVTNPVADAVITVDGKETAFKTDADGKVSITLEDAGEKVISAKSASQTLVPPAVIVTVSGESAAETTEPASTEAAETTTTAETTLATTTTAVTTTTMTTVATTKATVSTTTTMTTAPNKSTTSASSTTSPGTGDGAGLGAALVLAGAAVGAAAFAISRKHED